MQRADLVEGSRFVLVALELVEDLAAGSRQVGYEADVISETDQESPVARLENVVQEGLQVVVVRFYVMFLAAAYVNDQAEGKRKISAAREERYVLGHAVF